MALTIRNPHSILAAIEARPADVLELSLPPSWKTDRLWSSVAQAASGAGVRLAEGHPQASRNEAKREMRGDKYRTKLAIGGRVGAGEALVKERSPIEVEALLPRSPAAGLWLALDCLQDPHNVGAIFRTAAFFGVKGVILTQERSAPMSSATYDVASGGLEHVPFSMPVNLQRALETVKDRGIWVLGTSEHAPEDFRSVPRDRAWLLVLGNEENGLRRLTEERCDLLCGIPAAGKVTSLNVSVAAGILISHFA